MNMGRTLANITIALCLTALSASCAHDNAYVDIDDPGMHDIELSGTNPFTVNFRASAEWYARIFYEQGDTTRWLNVTPLSGSPNITSVTIMAKSANYTGSDRHADVEIKLPGNVGTQIRVTQPAVARPRQLSGIRRTLIGGTLDGPAELSFEYADESDEVTSFTTGSGDGAVTYSVEKGSSSGTVTMASGGSESSFQIKMLDGRAYGYENLEWSFADANTGIILNRSTVSISLSYDNSEDKLLQKITRNETMSMRNGETLDTAQVINETFDYFYDNLRVDSICHITTYNPNDEAKMVQDTVQYKLNYPTQETGYQDNNLTANVWNIFVLPEAQGTPFYSLTGFWLLGLTGDPQSNFPESADITTQIHSQEGLQTSWPTRYLYSYHRNGDELSDAATDIVFPSSTPRLTMTFSYETPAATERRATTSDTRPPVQHTSFQPQNHTRPDTFPVPGRTVNRLRQPNSFLTATRPYLPPSSCSQRYRTLSPYRTAIPAFPWSPPASSSPRTRSQAPAKCTELRFLRSFYHIFSLHNIKFYLPIYFYIELIVQCQFHFLH